MTLPVPSTPENKPERKSSGALMPRVKPAALTMGIFGAVLVILQLVNWIMKGALTAHLGIMPRSVGGLVGILTAPLVHLNWGHLLSNLVPFLILGFLVMVGSVRQFVAVTVLVWLVSGIGVWLIGPSGYNTVGASGLVFGWLAYLVFRGVFTKNWGQIGLGILLLVVYGGVFWTGIFKVVITGNTAVSWQGHLFGAIGGVLAAFLVAKADGPRRPKEPAAAPQLSPGI